jgi:hypothetical protein
MLACCRGVAGHYDAAVQVNKAQNQADKEQRKQVKGVDATNYSNWITLSKDLEVLVEQRLVNLPIFVADPECSRAL